MKEALPVPIIYDERIPGTSFITQIYIKLKSSLKAIYKYESPLFRELCRNETRQYKYSRKDGHSDQVVFESLFECQARDSFLDDFLFIVV